MRFAQSSATCVAILSSVVVAQIASEVTNNPSGVTYGATLPNSVTTNIRGSLVAQSDPSGLGVLFQISFSGFPSEGGPFLYHIHNNDTCASPGSHLDPYSREENPACDSEDPADCQVGDLSGKHGVINGTDFSANYVDDFVSMVPNTPAYIGNRTIVVHFANKTIITCGEMKMLANGTDLASAVNSSTSSATGSVSSGTSTASATNSGTSATRTSSGTATASTVSLTGGVGSLTVEAGAVVVGMAALFL